MESHHRALIITVVIALVIAVFGIGVAAASDDTDDTGHSSFGAAADMGATSSEYWQSITLVVVGRGTGGSGVNITPAYERSQCVRHDATSPGQVHASNVGTTVNVGVTVVGGMWTSCGYKESRMSWSLAAPGLPGGRPRVVALVKPAGGALEVDCQGAGGCIYVGPTAMQIGV